MAYHNPGLPLQGSNGGKGCLDHVVFVNTQWSVCHLIYMHFYKISVT